jgi:hypothetical protein
MRTPLLVALACLAQLWIAPSAIAQDKSPYMEECEKKGVPLPPKWGDPLWRKVKKTLPIDMTFDFGKEEKNPYDETQVWVYGTDTGTCMALPRLTKGKILALGIICQSDSGNACFWDNIPIGKDPDKDRIEGDATKGMDPAKIQDGSNLKEICTNCHRGRSVFIVHPGTALDPKTWAATGFDEPPAKSGAPKKPETPEPPPVVKKPTWYNPVSGQPSWENPRGEELKQCTASCHEMPGLSEGYCRLLSREVGKSMPPDDKDEHLKLGVWKPEFEEDVKILTERCAKFGSFDWPK